MATRIVKAKPPIAEVLVYKENSDTVLLVKKFCKIEDAREFALNRFGWQGHEGVRIGRMEVREIQS